VTTGTPGNDVLSNDQSVPNEVVDALAGDDRIIVTYPVRANDSVTVHGGDGFDTLEISDQFNGVDSRSFISVRKSSSIQGPVFYDGIERILVTGQMVGNGPFILGGTQDILTLTGTTGGISIDTGDASDSITLLSNTSGASIQAGAGDDLIDLRQVQGGNPFGASYSLRGGEGNDTVIGSNFVDLLYGGAGNDILDGHGTAAAPDYLFGETGDDVYIVRHQDTVVTEVAGEGDDEIRTALTRYTLSAENVERLTGTNAAGQYLIGNGGANMLTGAGGNDILDGAGGADTLRGGAGDDNYYVESGDTIVELDGEGYDYVYARTSFGLAAGLAVELLGTIDYRLTDPLTLAGNESNNQVVGNNGHNALYGGGGDDTVTGLAGQDVLDGGEGNDYLIGGTGDDIYYVEGLDVAEEQVGEGYDAVYVRSSYALTTLSEIEMLATYDYRGTEAFALTGNQLNNNVVGNNGNNVLDGRAGDDTLRGLDGDDTLYGGEGSDYLIGGTGNDIYYVDSGDTVEEAAGEGSDAVYASASFTLTAGAEVELIGTQDHSSTAALDLAGNGFAQSIVGNAGANLIRGGGGADTLRGLGGDDVLDGGSGQDYLIGGDGADTFRFAAAGDSAAGAADTIADFVSGSDRIDLSLIDANANTAGDDAFTFIGSNAFSGKAGELRVEGSSGVFFVYGDTNGDGQADFQIIVYGASLASGDFNF
jgi:Ca2+-binding RTX toxin-like protein